VEQGRCRWHLDNWAAWMRGYCPTRGYPSRAAGLRTGGAVYGDDFEALVAQADRRCAQAVDAVVSELPIFEQKALQVRHLALEWRYIMLDLEQVYDHAVVMVGLGLDVRGIA